MLHLPRRDMLGCACAGLAASLVHPAALRAATSARTELTPDEALAILKEGNARFIADEAAAPILDSRRRLEISRGQTPFAVLVGCSDSRVPPELLFGRGLDELFIVRNAGNTVDTSALGSVEYAVVELGVPLIVVLGHERCGAVAAAIEVVERDLELPGAIGRMVEPILPAVLKAKHRLDGADAVALLDAAVRENVSRVAQDLRSSAALLESRVQAGSLKIVGARYDLDNGEVEFFEES